MGNDSEKIPIVIWNIETKKIVAISDSMYNTTRFITGRTNIKDISLVRYAIKHTGIIAKNKNILGCDIKLKYATKKQSELLEGKKLITF